MSKLPSAPSAKPAVSAKPVTAKRTGKPVSKAAKAASEDKVSSKAAKAPGLAKAEPDPATRSKPVAARPVASVKPVVPAKPAAAPVAAAAKPVEPATTAKPAKPVESVASAELARPAERAKPVEAAETAKPAIEVKPHPAPVPAPAPLEARVPMASPAPAVTKAVEVGFAATLVPSEALPKAMQEFAQSGLGQAREAYQKARLSAESFSKSLGSSGEAAATGLQDFSRTLLDAIQANTDATLGYLRAMSGVRSVSEAVELQARHARTQFETVSEQAKALATIANRTVTQTAKPVREALDTAFRQQA